MSKDLRPRLVELTEICEAFIELPRLVKEHTSLADPPPPDVKIPLPEYVVNQTWGRFRPMLRRARLPGRGRIDMTQAPAWWRHRHHLLEAIWVLTCEWDAGPFLDGRRVDHEEYVVARLATKLDQIDKRQKREGEERPKQDVWSLDKGRVEGDALESDTEGEETFHSLLAHDPRETLSEHRSDFSPEEAAELSEAPSLDRLQWMLETSPYAAASQTALLILAQHMIAGSIATNAGGYSAARLMGADRDAARNNAATAAVKAVAEFMHAYELARPTRPPDFKFVKKLGGEQSG